MPPRREQILVYLLIIKQLQCKRIHPTDTKFEDLPGMKTPSNKLVMQGKGSKLNTDQC
ncbi:hypothetical protein LOAG_17757 [Loa loa]|uniref:Uncharacterized protein n=1 Tax=Loa loa TaxID=7209 RepID=A0A1S0UHT1_LOALO|nr:hypothetical protein LOAG_17757 [Loa loa]EJD75021.1 hypothetical protein LOAG_17757 [Loa loa]